MDIIIIKLGAKGDVVRTTPILEAIKKRFPESNITWVTKKDSLQILEKNPNIDKIETIPISFEKEFDILYNFDIDEPATSLASKMISKKKFGFYEEAGYPLAFNQEAEYYLNTLFDDELKKTNKKTYQEMMFDIASFEFNNQRPKIYLTEQEKKYGNDFLEKNNISSENLIGIHMGAGPRWPSKAWDSEKIKKLIEELKKSGKEVILFGGPNEIQSHNTLCNRLNEENIKVYRNNPKNTDREFFSLVNACSQMVCSDSFALHVSLAFNKPTVCLFFVTSPDEIEGYGNLKKIIAPKLYDFFPEKSDMYSEELVNSISVQQVLEALNSLGQKLETNK